MTYDHHKPLAKAEGFSFCESVYAGPGSPWHLRKLTSAGQKLGGGIDTMFLCRDEHVNGWDLRVYITEGHFMLNTCQKCMDKFVIQTGYKLPKEKENG